MLFSVKIEMLGVTKRRRKNDNIVDVYTKIYCFAPLVRCWVGKAPTKSRERERVRKKGYYSFCMLIYFVAGKYCVIWSETRCLNNYPLKPINLRLKAETWCFVSCFFSLVLPFLFYYIIHLNIWNSFGETYGCYTQIRGIRCFCKLCACINENFEVLQTDLFDLLKCWICVLLESYRFRLSFGRFGKRDGARSIWGL